MFPHKTSISNILRQGYLPENSKNNVLKFIDSSYKSYLFILRTVYFAGRNMRTKTELLALQKRWLRNCKTSTCNCDRNFILFFINFVLNHINLNLIWLTLKKRLFKKMST